MTRDDVFGDLVSLLASSDQEIDTTKLALNDEPFWVHGIDSMSLVRLIGEVEDKFTIELSDSDALIAFSFDRLVTLILDRIGERPDRPASRSRANFLDVLTARAHRAGDDAQVRRRLLRGDDVALSNEHLLRIAAHLGQQLPEPVDSRPQVVLVAARDPLITLLGFLTALSVEALPLILPHPKAMGGFETYLTRIERLTARFGNRPVVLFEPGILPDRAALGDLPVIDLPEQVESAPALAELPDPSTRSAGGDDVAFLQMTSASTGDAKLVAITHANICANLDAMEAELLTSAEGHQACSWMPLYHDMGLIGGALFPMYGGFSTILMRPNDFIKNPGRWIRTLDEFRVTFTGAPNFGVDYTALMLTDGALAGVDLSCIRRFGLAAEPIHRTTVQRWLDRFGAYGFSPEAFVPGFGMAESTLSTTTRSGREPRYLVVETSGAVVGEPVRVLGAGVCTHPTPPVPELPEGVSGVAVFSLGTAVAGLEVDLRDEEGVVLTNERTVGEICVRGTSVAGYYDTATGRGEPVADGVLRTGDLGFSDDGELFILERLKNVVIRKGVNHLVSLLEQRVAEVFDILAHGVLIFDEDIYDPASPIHVVIEAANHLDAPTPEQRTVLRNLELPIDIVTFARGFALPRTTSGKKRYHVGRQMLINGEFAVVQQFDLR